MNKRKKSRRFWQNPQKKGFELYNKGVFKKLAKLDNEILSEIMEELKADQKRGFNKFLGEPFKGKMPPANYFPLSKKVREGFEK